LRRRLAADLALGGGEQDGLFVGEVLIEGADAHPGALGDAGGGEPGRTIALQNLSRGFQNRVPGRPRPRLARPTPLKCRAIRRHPARLLKANALAHPRWPGLGVNDRDPEALLRPFASGGFLELELVSELVWGASRTMARR
jgi:hypothetical protein